MKQIKKENIESEIIKSITSPELKEIGSEIGEIAIDSLIEEGIFKEIPILNTISNLYSAGVTISGKIFERKLISFLLELEKTPIEKREQFVNKIEKDKKFKKKLSEHLLIIIDRIDDMAKPKFIAQLFSKFILGEVNYEIFMRLTSVIDKSLISDLNQLKNFEVLQYSSFTAISLENTGLVYTAVNNGGYTNQKLELINGNRYFISELGKLLLSTIELKTNNG